MDEDKEKEEQPTLGTLITVGVVVMTVVIALGLYQWYSGPQRTADKLHDELASKNNVSDEYARGWNDCVKFFLDMHYKASNVTSSNISS